MAKCECGCNELPEAGQFVPGHDQRLRIQIEDSVGGVLPLRNLIESAHRYVQGELTAEQFESFVRKTFYAVPRRKK